MTLYINRDLKTNYNQKRIRRIMNTLNLQSVIRRKRKYNYKKSTPEQTAENILARDFYALDINEKWCTDVTEFKINNDSRKLYLCAIIDLYDRSIVSYQISNRNDNKLVFDAFKKAVKVNPNAKPIFHSDRGYQFTSNTFKKMLEEQGMIQSMSRVGKCIDNCPIEGWWSIIKTEMVDYKKCNNLDELKIMIQEYIKFYNNGRYQERYNSLTPMEVRNNAIKAKSKNELIKEYPIKINSKIIKYYKTLEEKTTKDNYKSN